MALNAFDIRVASATPDTLILHTITKNKLSITFNIPETIIIYRGLLVSPMLRNMAEPKLYITINGRPLMYILK